MERILAELCGQCLGVADVLVQLRPERLLMMFDARVDELVQQHVVNENRGQADEFEVQAEVILRGAAAPHGPLLAEAHPTVSEAVGRGEALQARQQLADRCGAVNRRGLCRHQRCSRLLDLPEALLLALQPPGH